MLAFARMQQVLAYAAANLDSDLSLGALAAQVGLSRFHLQREFGKITGETPRSFAFRLRLTRAAALLLTTQDSILGIALASGFQNHETFSRAFQRHWGMSPRAYRKRGFAQKLNLPQVRLHASVVDRIAPCVGLYRMNQKPASEVNRVTYSVIRKTLEAQPVLVQRRKVKRSSIAATIAEVLPQVFLYAQQRGIALAGLPLTRYVEVTHGFVTIEPGMRIAAPTAPPASEGSPVLAATLPGGPAASTLHTGPYEGLPDAYAAIEQWIEAQGLASAGAPWECYINDPSEHPDPKDWKTEVFWPLAR